MSQIHGLHRAEQIYFPVELRLHHHDVFLDTLSTV